MNYTTSSVSEIITNTKQNTTEQLTTVKNVFKPTDNCTVEEADQLFEMLPHLVNPQFKAWYCSRFYTMPRTRVMEIASLAAADGREPRKLFSFLLKQS